MVVEAGGGGGGGGGGMTVGGGGGIEVVEDDTEVDEDEGVESTRFVVGVGSAVTVTVVASSPPSMSIMEIVVGTDSVTVTGSVLVTVCVAGCSVLMIVLTTVPLPWTPPLPPLPPSPPLPGSPSPGSRGTTEYLGLSAAAAATARGAEPSCGNADATERHADKPTTTVRDARIFAQGREVTALEGYES